MSPWSLDVFLSQLLSDGKEAQPFPADRNAAL